MPKFPISKESLLVVASYAVLPWSMFWCLVSVPGAVKAVAKGQQGRREALMHVLAAPVTRPLGILLRRESTRQEREFRRKTARRLSAKRWLHARLQRQGFAVHAEAPSGVELILRTEVPDRRRDEFGDIYAEAALRFETVPIRELCAGDAPMHLLDAKWAKKHGFAAWPSD